jgi:hypothetical protein
VICGLGFMKAGLKILRAGRWGVDPLDGSQRCVRFLIEVKGGYE